MKKPGIVVVLLAVASGLAFAEGAPPTAEALIENVASTWDPLRVRLLATMTVRQPGRPDLETELLIRRAGFGRTRVDFLSPAKDRGKALLQDGAESWLYLPRTGRVIEVPARRSPLAGGVLFEDLFPGGEADPGESTVEATDDAFVLIRWTLRGREKKKAGSSRIYFDRTTLMPVRREVYSSSDKLLKTVRIDEWGEWNGTKIPWKISFEDHLREGGEAHIEVIEARALTPEDERLVSRERLGEP